MSLRGFHLLFVGVCLVLCGGLGLWGLRGYTESGSAMPLLVGAGGVLAGLILAVYGRWFVRKMRGVHPA